MLKRPARLLRMMRKHRALRRDGSLRLSLFCDRMARLIDSGIGGMLLVADLGR